MTGRATIGGPGGRTAAALVLLACSSLAPAAGAADLTGRVDAVSHGRTIPGEASHAVVYYEPDTPIAFGSPKRSFTMSTRDKSFEPRVVAVPKGASVSFLNRDPILHNVFSVSEPYRFDLGFYGEGKAESVTFDRPGVVRVFCNVHQGMVGYVLVLDTPFYTSPDAQGRFRLSGLPEGTGTLTVWHEQAEVWTGRVKVTAGATASQAVRIELTKPRIPAHLDKFGRSYRSRRGRYRGH